MKKANLRELKAATGLVILLKLDSNCRFSASVILKFDGWPRKTIGHLLYYVKHCASFQSHRWIQTGVTVWKSSIRVLCDLEIWRMTLKTIGHLFYTMSSFVHHFKAICWFKLELQSGNAHFGSKSAIFFVPCDIEIWQMSLKNNRHLFYATSNFVYHFIASSIFKLELQSGNAQCVWKLMIFFVLCDLEIQ